jgi:hypothetical protein
MKKSSNKIRNLVTVGIIGVTVAPVLSPVTQVLAAETGSSSSSEANKPSDVKTVDPKSELTQVVSVNGNKLVKDKVVKPGDTVTFDIVYFPGNKGLMTEFKDTLPDGLKFNPNSKYAATVFAVNNDGTVGDEITDKGKAKLEGKTWSWVPNNPKDYFFVGKEGKQNRLLFHITTTVENNAEAGKIMENLASGTTENPKDPGKPTTVDDTAKIRIPKDPKDPTIEKSVYLQDKDGNIDLALPGSDSKDNSETDGSKEDNSTEDSGNKAEDVEINISSEDSVDKMKESMQKLIDLSKTYKVDTTKQEKMISELKDDADQDTKNEFVKSFTELKEALNKAIEDGVKPNTDGDNSGNTEGNSNDNIDLPEHDSLYTYVVDVKIPSQSIKKKLTIEDPIEHVQSFDLKDVTVYNGKGEDVTKQGKVGVKNNKDKKVVTWTASDEFISSLKENKNTSLQLRIKNVTLKGANKDDEANYVTGGVVTIPNIANLIWDDKTTPSNETVVRPPEDPENPQTSIRKSVVLQDEKLDTITNPYQKDNGNKDTSNTTSSSETETSGTSESTNESSTTESTSRSKLENLVKEAEAWVKKDGLDENAVALVNSNIKSSKLNLDDKNAKDKDLDYYYSALKEALTKAGWTESTDSTTEKDSTSETGDKTEDTSTEPKKGDVVADPIDFERGSSTLKLPGYDSYYKYLVEVSVNPNDVKKSLVIEDNIENIQADSISLDNVKIYDETGKDVTESFALDLDKDSSDTQVKVSAKANKELVNKVHQRKENSKFQMVIYNVQLQKASDEQADRYTEDGKLKVPNVASINTDGKKIDSNKTIVTPPTPENPTPDKPENPRKPDIKTGIQNVATNPITIIAALAIIAGGITVYFKTRKATKK